MASGARPGVRLVSVEADGERAEAAKAVFAGAPQVTVVHGDWRELREFGPFEMLVLDGGGQGKGDVQPIDPASGCNWAAWSSSTTSLPPLSGRQCKTATPTTHTSTGSTIRTSWPPRFAPNLTRSPSSGRSSTSE